VRPFIWSKGSFKPVSGPTATAATGVEDTLYTRGGGVRDDREKEHYKKRSRTLTVAPPGPGSDIPVASLWPGKVAFSGYPRGSATEAGKQLGAAVAGRSH